MRKLEPFLVLKWTVFCKNEQIWLFLLVRPSDPPFMLNDLVFDSHPGWVIYQ